MLKIQLFSDFAILEDGKLLFSGYFRKNKAIYLLIYLFAHKGKGFTKEDLIRLLYLGEDFSEGELVNSLKIVVYRARKHLDSLGLPGSKVIINKKGKYSLNENYNIEIDSQEFIHNLNKAETEEDEEKKIQYLRNAIDLYEGDFLPDMSTEEWVRNLALDYQSKFHKAVQESFDFLNMKKDYPAMLNVSLKAINLLYGHEAIHVMRIYSLYKNGYTHEALTFYNETIEMLFNKLGVSPSEELLQLYDEMSQELASENVDIREIREILNRESQKDGAYYSTFQNFIDSYQLMVRTMERTGFSSYLMLCTLKDYEYAGYLKTAIRQSLRKSDSFSRYSPTQYMILLMGTNYDNCELVYNRIEKAYFKLAGKDPAKLSYSVISALETEE